MYVLIAKVHGIKKSKMIFNVWVGATTQSALSGAVMIYATKHHSSSSDNGMVQVKLDDVEYSPGGSLNLLNLGRMERNG